MGLHNDFVIAIFVDLYNFVDGVRQLYSRAIHFHAQLLPEIDFDVSHFESDGLGPAGMFRLTRIVRHTNGEGVIDAVSRKLIFAGALKAKKFPVKCFVVWISEHGAHRRTLDAFGTALAFRHDEVFIRPTLYLGTLRLCAANFTSSTLARLARPEIPSFIVLRRG